MTEVKLVYSDEHYETEEDFLLEIALRRRYKSALFEIANNLWRRWKHDDTDLNVDSLREEILKIITENGLTFENFD